MGELNATVIYLYMLITSLCLLLITIFTIMNCNKKSSSDFTNLSRLPFHGYTHSDIDLDWAKLNCPAHILTQRQKDQVFNIGNNPRFNKITARNRALDELQRIKNRSVCTSRNIPQNELDELSNLWKSTNCVVPFPIIHVQNMYKNSPNRSFENRKKDFQRYIQIMNDNFAGKDVDPWLSESLERSFQKCYGDNWRNTEEVFKQYQFLQSFT